MGQTIVDQKTLIPASLVLAAIVLTTGVVRMYDAAGADTQRQVQTLKADVAIVDSRMGQVERRLDQADDHWMQVLSDLSKIKERLGIVEARSPRLPGQN
jgi:hypothetical protein